MVFEEVKGFRLYSTLYENFVGTVPGFMQDCYSALNLQWFSQLLMTLVKIIQNWWKHEAGLERGLEEAAKSLLLSMREMLMSLCLPVA